MSGQKVKVNNSDIYYEKHGTGSHVLLLVPGGIGTIRTDMKPLIDAISQTKYTVIAIDPLGYGKSRPPDRDYSKGVGLFQMDAEIGVEIMKCLGHESFDWIGWSDGGRAGLVAASSFPSRINRLVIWGANAFVTKRQQLAMEAARDLKYWMTTRREVFIEEYGDEETAAELWARHVDFYQTLGNICQESISKIRCPTLVMHGDRDPVEKDLVQQMANQISDCEFHSFPDAGHSVHIEKSKDFVRIVEDFLDQEL